MKNYKSGFALILLSLFTFACGPKGETVETTDAKKVATSSEAIALQIDTDKSQVTWVGSKPTGQHNGTIKLTKGEVSIKEGQVVAGNFVIDINSLENLDMAGSKGATDLKGHLMSDHFFDAANYPEATFEVTDVAPFSIDHLDADKDEYQTEYAPKKLSEVLVENPTHFISGNLTMRGTTKNVTFPASISVENGMVNAKASFNIDRTAWGLSYGDEASALDKAKDKFLYNTVNVGFEITITKASL